MLGGMDILEPVVANAQNAPCADDSAEIIGTTDVGGVVEVEVARATTDVNPNDLSAAPAANGDSGTATSEVTSPVINLPGLVITADVLSARAAYTCQGGQPVASGSSVVANLTVNGQAITLPPDNAPFSVDVGPLATLLVNQTVQGPNTITQRALELRVPNDGSVATVIIGEAIADFTGNPCTLAAAPAPQCSDGVDNDGDGRIDAQDPGCLSGPGGSFNPQDNDETDGARPQCSDGVDNDGDGRIDAQDPGCLSGPGGSFNPQDNDERDLPNCSDGIDNDRDGRIDFPADKGCTSAADLSEGTATGKAKLTTDPAGIARRGVRGSCRRGSFMAIVTGRRILRVTFALDGRSLRTDSQEPYTARISARRAGRHRVTARVRFLSDSGTRARTLSFSFRRCAAGKKAVRFTG
ncbi:MAG: hypothetical protein H0V81_04810 [Solirubrobacterales bacterium]|nr:hypothetical protein [Solirubrobacterales bacterium]